jgi:Icc-related predicted phosphoesterase
MFDLQKEKKVKFGIMNDIHGTDVSTIVNEMVKERVSAILVNGDVEGFEDLEKTLKPFYEAPCPVLIMPGNMDSRENLEKHISSASDNYPQIINMEKKKMAKIKNVTILPYISSSSDTGENLLLNFLSSKEPVIIQSHFPPYGYSDVVGVEGNAKSRGKFKHAGDKKLAEIIEYLYSIDRTPTVVVFGHIHESHEFYPPATQIGKKLTVYQKQFVKGLCLNPGAAKDGFYSILTIKGKKAMYELRNVNSIAETHIVDFMEKRFKTFPDSELTLQQFVPEIQEKYKLSSRIKKK